LRLLILLLKFDVLSLHLSHLFEELSILKLDPWHFSLYSLKIFLQLLVVLSEGFKFITVLGLGVVKRFLQLNKV
jgi:hypothetical protein